MNLRIATCSLAASAAFLGINPLTAAAAPSVAFKTPTSGGTISGNIYQSSACEVAGSSIDRVRFYLDSTALNTEESSPWNCNIDTRKFSDGTHALRAVAYDSAGASASAQISVNIKNSTTTTTTTTSGLPTVAWQMPAEGGALKGDVQGPPNCVVSGSNIARVMFYINGVWTNTDGNLDNGLGCWIDTTKYKDGAYTLKAVAYNAAGQTASAERSIVIQNTTSTTTPTANTPPAVSFKAPLNGATVSGSLSSSACEALASDSNGIKQVQFFMDGTALNTELSSPWNCALDTRKFADGAHTLKAVATDKLGAASTAQIGITVNNGTTTTTPTTSTLPAPKSGSLDIWFKQPAKGATVSGLLQLDKCYVAGKSVSRVNFFLDSTALNSDTNVADGMSCVLDTTKFANGSHTLKAVAYDSSGKSYTEGIGINIQNATSTPTTPTTGTAPTVSFKAPTSGATLSGSISQSSACEVTGSNIAKVVFSLDGTALNTELSSPWNCNLDTTKFADGSHTLMATAYNSSGVAASSQISVNIKNGTTATQPSTPTASTIDLADIRGWASADVLFSQQSGYNTQVIGQYISAQSIPESGIHGTVLSNGESLRLGKDSDPLNSTRKALAFQVSPTDPDTSGAKRAELKFPNHVELNTVYWAAFSVYVRDWGTLSSTDHALFGLQVHGGCCDLSPSVAVYSRGGKTFYVDARYSTGNPGTQSTSSSVRSAEYPVPFGRWVDMVFKFKLDPAGGGFLQAWMDGSQIMNYSGRLGYYTDGSKPYFKFGYYNWTSFDSARKVMLRSPVYLVDPTGSKYKPEDLRAYINAQP